MDFFLRIVRYLSKRDFSHVEDVNLAECGGFLRERKYLLSIIYEESGSHPVKIEHNNKTRSQHSSQSEESRSCSSCSEDEEFSSTEDTPVDRVKNRKKKKRAKHIRREIISEERSLFTLEL